MELRDVIAARRSIRKYDPTKDVEQEKIEALLEAARLCQSGHNRQPWKFMILRGEQKKRVTDLMREYDFGSDDEAKRKHAGTARTASVMDEAPVLILAFRIDEDPHHYYSDMVSMGAAIEHICLTATDLGLGALWIRQTMYVEDDIAASFGYPDYHMISAISIGYPAESPAPRPRKSMEDIIIEPIK